MSFSLNQTADIFALCKTNVVDSIDSGNFSVRCYLFLIEKDIMLLIKEVLPFEQDLSVENSVDSYLCFRLALLYSVSYFFFLYQSDSANMFVFGDFDVHH